MTHHAPANRWSLFSFMVSVVEHILFSGPQIKRCMSFCFSDGRTDTMRENNDHQFGRGQVVQKGLKGKGKKASYQT